MKSWKYWWIETGDEILPVFTMNFEIYFHDFPFEIVYLYL